MSFSDLFNNAELQYLTGTEITTTIILVFMAYSIALSVYLYCIYRVSSRSSFYSPVFGKTLIGMGIITTGIILAMQSSLVVSLGMVGALSIVRFRNAVKSPLDLLFLFWAISNGIICGTGYVEIALVVSAVMSVLVLGFDFLPFGNSSYIVTIYGNETFDETTLLQNIKPFAQHAKVRTRSLYDADQELLLELHTKKCKELLVACKETDGVTGASIIYHDGEVRF
ncbi:MAG: DUF4956 domain-containing protein [Faecalibacterium sp.]